jgi:hypothetical protein
MSGTRDPLGPQPNRVYWRRRMIVLGGLVLIIAVIVLIIVRPTDSPPPVSAETSAPPAETAETPAPPVSTDPVPCDASQISLVAVTDADSYAEGVDPQLSWTVSNVGSVPCIIDVGPSHQLFTVTSGEETIWTSSDCQSDQGDYALTLEPGSEPTSSVSIDWDRTRSAPDTCDSEREPVTAGGASYHLNVEVGGFTSAETKQFLLN